jgi:hypothetical protein
VLTLSERLDNQGKGEKAQEENIELFEAGENAAEALESSEKAFDLVALAVHRAVILPGIETIAFGGNDRNIAEIQLQLKSFIAFLGFVHDQAQRRRQRTDAGQQFPPFCRIGCLTRRERKGYSRSRIRGNHMNLCGPSAARFSNGLSILKWPP